MSNNPQLSAFEKSTYKFITNLKDLPSNIRILHSSEYKRAITLISCVRNLMGCVGKELEEIEKNIKEESRVK